MTLERASPSARHTGFIGRPRATRASAQSFFFGGVFHGFLEDLVLQGLLAQHALQLGNLGTGGRQLRCGHDGLASGDGRLGTLSLELAPLEQQAGGNTFLPGHEGHAHAGLVGAFDQG
jgi:hypothetical protein